MAILVPIKPGDEPVTARIRIKGIVFWHFLYVADGGELAKSGTSDDVHDFELGEPAKLHRDVNTWHVVLQNPNKAPVRFAVQIVWLQGERVIATWPEDGPGAGSLKGKEHTVLDDSAFLAVLEDATGESE